MVISLIMLCLVMLSVGSAFAADNNSDLANDDLTGGETLAISDDTQVASDETVTSDVVTKENFNNYFDGNGSLLSNVTAKELTFSGEISDVGVNTIVLDRSITLTGNNATLSNIAIDVKASDVVISGLTLNQNNGTYAISAYGTSNVNITDSIINFEAIANEDGYAIKADNVSNLYLLRNAITYVGTTTGSAINNAILLSNAKNALIEENLFDLYLVSSYVPWAEVPAGSGNWVSAPISEGIVIESSNDVKFSENLVDVIYNNVSGSYDTIYAIDFKDSDNAMIKENIINAVGNTYIYGMTISGENFAIRSNNITVESDYYANGIDIEGPATGVVEDNVIDVKANNSVYGIYSGMNGADVTAEYTGNNITGSAYNVFGFSLGDVSSHLESNYVDLTGNYTTGIAYRGSYINAEKNRIILTSSEEGNMSVSESFGVETVGIKVVQGNASITDNVIATQGKGISITGATYFVEIEDNFINVVANVDKDAYAIYAADVPILDIYTNTIDYQGTTMGTGINNAVYLTNASDSRIFGNTFELDLVSSYVPWFEIPAGSGNWVSFPVSEGIVVEDSDDAVLADNKINVVYGDVVGSYDTIYAVSFKNSDNAVITLNNITALGNTYIYGIQVSGENFTIDGNKITVESDYYANGIDIEGPATGVVEDNVIDIKANTSVYAIYSGMNGADVTAEYTGNNITGSAYNVFGFSLGDVSSHLESNYIDLTGNYTTGIAYRGYYINANDNRIILTSSEQGNETIWENFGVETVGVKVINGSAVLTNNTIAGAGIGVYLTGKETNGYLGGNFINVVGNDDEDAYAIYAEDIPNLFIIGNNVDYQGTTAGTGINNAVYLNNVTGSMIALNKFELDLVSSYVPWFEIPAGSGNWVSFPVSEGIVVEDSNNVILGGNEINVAYGDVVGSYDTIYAVNFKNSDNSYIVANNITALGHTYIYGIQISGENFTISENKITVESDNYYANGIDIEGPASGVVKSNDISVAGVESAYAIYSGMNGQDVSSVYENNTLAGVAYNVFGMSLGDVETNITENTIELTGNYTTGIAYRGSKLLADKNVIIACGSNEGDLPVWESFGVENIGIKVVAGESTITNNQVLTSGNYAIDVRGTEALVHDNILIGKKYAGDDSVANATKSNVYNNTPVIENKTLMSITITEVNGDGNVSGILATAVDGIPIPDDEITYSFDGLTSTVKTDNEGKFVIPAGNGKVEISYAGDSYLSACNATIALTDVVDPVKVESRFNITGGSITLKGYAIDKKAGEKGMTYATELLDINGNPISNVTIQFAINDKIHSRVTYENGSFAPYELNMLRAGRYTLAFSFGGDDQYNSTFAVVCIDLDKKPIKIKASAKTYKASAKTKKYTVTLSTIAGSSADGKAHLRTGLKVTMQIKGKTYTGKTNSKGQVSFNIKITKKGKYTAKISYAGDQTYNSASKSVKITIN